MECIDEILPLITRIINLSLTLGNMPDSLKHAIITPLKKLNLELLKKNYRPVYNLAFLSKLIERAVASQLIDHLSENELMTNTNLPTENSIAQKLLHLEYKMIF